MAKKLAKTMNGYVVWGGEFGGPERVSTARVKELGLDEGFGVLGTRRISDLEYSALIKKYF